MLYIYGSRAPIWASKGPKTPQKDAFPVAALKVIKLMLQRPKILTQIQSFASPNLIHIKGDHTIHLRPQGAPSEAQNDLKQP